MASAKLTGDESAQVRAWQAWLVQYMAAEVLRRDAARADDIALMSELSGIRDADATYAADQASGMTVFLYGGFGSRKTTWAASAPGAYFLSCGLEGGDVALDYYPRIALKMLNAAHAAQPLFLADGTPTGVVPPVFNAGRPASKVISSVDGLAEKANQLAKTGKANGVRTVVVDSVTYLQAMWMNEITQGGAKCMRIQDWGTLSTWMRNMQINLQEAGLNVIWLATETEVVEPDDKNFAKKNVGKVLPAMKGSARNEVMGACKIIMRAERMLEAAPGMGSRKRAVPRFWAEPSTLDAQLRHKFYDSFPRGMLEDPVFGTEPTFGALYRAVGDYITL